MRAGGGRGTIEGRKRALGEAARLHLQLLQPQLCHHLLLPVGRQGGRLERSSAPARPPRRPRSAHHRLALQGEQAGGDNRTGPLRPESAA